VKEDKSRPVMVSRRIGAPAADVFRILANPGHPGAGGSWGQRWSFELTPDGPDATIVTEIYDCSRAPDEERADMDNGAVWIESMTRTLERLDALSSR
jgi:hypothetical protein